MTTSPKKRSLSHWSGPWLRPQQLPSDPEPLDPVEPTWEGAEMGISQKPRTLGIQTYDQLVFV